VKIEARQINNKIARENFKEEKKIEEFVLKERKNEKEI
jgi:hypothetical protein